MTRHPLLFTAALLALLGSLVALFGTLHERDTHLRGYADATQSADLPFRIPRLGVNAELTQYTAGQLRDQLDAMQAAHIHWVRQLFRWDQIEPRQGEYDWSRADEIVSSFAQRPDLRLVAVLVNTPPWARSMRPASNANDPTTPPDDPATFAAFAGVFAARYGEVVSVYQVWDEPNLTAMWGGLDPRPVEYAALLQAAYTAVHQADRTATVIAAALAPTTETGPRNISDWLYLQDLYTLGARDFMDAAAGKPYGFNEAPTDRSVRADTLNFSRFVALREIMQASGDGNKALWGSNWGWNNLATDWPGAPSVWGSVTAEQQIAFTLDALARAEREWPWLGGLILHHWQPDAAPDDPVWGFSLLTPDGSPTPLLEALRARPQPTHAENGLFHPTTAYARYSGVWTFGTLGADIGWLQDSRLEFDFAGRDIALLLRRDNYVAYLYPTINGQPANALPRDADGNAYLVLTSGSLRPELSLVQVARNLADRPHTLSVIADRGFDRWALAGFAVSSGDLAEPYQRQAALATFTAIAALAAAVITGAQINWRPLVQLAERPWRALDFTWQLVISVITSLALMFGLLLTWGDAAPAIFRREPIQLGIALLSAGLVYLNPGFVITVIAALVLGWVIYNRLVLGLLLIVFYAPFFLFPVELYRFAFPMTELLTLITTIAWLLRGLAAWGQARQTGAQRYPLRSPALSLIDHALIAWGALAALSLAWATYTNFALTELRTLFIEPLLFYAILRTTPLTDQDRQRLVDALLLAAIVVSMIGLGLYLRGEAVITAEGEARRLASVYGSPNNVALLLGRALPFALAFSLLPLDRWRRGVAAGAVALFLITMLLTQSVGGLLIGVPAGVAGVLLALYGRRALLPLAVLALLAGAAFAVGAAQSERFARALDFTQGTNLYRIRVWQSALQAISDHPLTGLGLDQFLYAFRGYYIQPDAWQDPDLSHPHNILLDFWVRLGIAGVIVLAALQLGFWQRVRAAQPRNLTERALIAGITGCMLNLLAHGLIDNSIYVLDLIYIFMLLLWLVQTLQSARQPAS